MADKISKRAEESNNYMDKLQDEGQMTQGDKVVQQEPMNSELKEEKKDSPKANDEVKFDRSSVELDVPLEEFEPEKPKEVEDDTVIYVPHKDFGARINQTEYIFRKGVKTRVHRDLANMLLEDDSRGYIYE